MRTVCHTRAAGCPQEVSNQKEEQRARTHTDAEYETKKGWETESKSADKGQAE